MYYTPKRLTITESAAEVTIGHAMTVLSTPYRNSFNALSMFSVFEIQVWIFILLSFIIITGVLFNL